MVSSRKRGREQMEEPAKVVEAPKEPSLLEKIRNMWEFANLSQWIFIFGRAVKIDENLDIDDLEMECLKSRSAVLPEIGLALLKFISSHRGLTPEIFDEYTRRQYVAKAPHRNPFGIEEEPTKFIEFDIFTKIRVLQQLTQWTLGNPDRIRERMEEQKDPEQTIWRIEPFGWDRDDRTYFVLDDNRLYRQTDPPPPPPPAPKVTKPKKNSKKAKAALRASKRRKVSQAAESDAEHTEEVDADAEEPAPAEKGDDGFGGMKWECIAVNFEEVNAFTASIEKSRDPNEKILYKRIKDDLLPLLEKQEEARKRKVAQKERELLNMEKLATAKRSSRIAGKMEHQKAEEEAREAERKKHADLAMAKKEQEKWMKLEKERESRMMTREQRLKEREARRILHEDELANLSEDSKKVDTGAARLSERHLKAEIERKKQALEELAEEDDWIFDCICGAYGQIDDGTHSIACEKCNIWQHSKCLKVSQAEAERDDFHFVCSTCQRRARDAELAKTRPPIKITLKRPGSSSSPNLAKSNGFAASPSNFVQSYQQASPSKSSAPPAYSGQSVQWQPPATYVPVAVPATQAPSNGQYSMPQKPTLPRPSSSHTFSPPRLESPNNYPPHVQNQAYSYANSNGSSYNSNMPNMPTPNQQHVSPYTTSPQHRSPYPPMHHFTHGTPASRANGSQHIPSSDIRRNSMTLNSSPTPVLTPVYKQPRPANYSSSPPAQYASAVPPISSIYQSASSPHLPPNQQAQDPNQILPPVATGYSPTKHSPPRTTISNGIFGLATPSILPPITSLSPSPQLQNFSPPVKPSEPERPGDYGQSVGS